MPSATRPGPTDGLREWVVFYRNKFTFVRLRSKRSRFVCPIEGFSLFLPLIFNELLCLGIADT